MIEIYVVIRNISNRQLFIWSAFVWKTDLSIRRNETQLLISCTENTYFCGDEMQWPFLMQSRTESLNGKGQRCDFQKEYSREASSIAKYEFHISSFTHSISTCWQNYDFYGLNHMRNLWGTIITRHWTGD